MIRDNIIPIIGVGAVALWLRNRRSSADKVIEHGGFRFRRKSDGTFGVLR